MREKHLKETGLADLAYRAESDHEVQMARADLYKIGKYAIKLHEMLKGVTEKEGLDGWVQSKITKAADYMGSVYHHLDYEMKFEEVAESINDDVTEDLAHMKDLAKGIAKNPFKGDKVAKKINKKHGKDLTGKDLKKEGIQEKLPDDGGMGAASMMWQATLRDYITGKTGTEEVLSFLSNYPVNKSKLISMLDARAMDPKFKAYGKRLNDLSDALRSQESSIHSMTDSNEYKGYLQSMLSEAVKEGIGGAAAGFAAGDSLPGKLAGAYVGHQVQKSLNKSENNIKKIVRALARKGIDIDIEESICSDCGKQRFVDLPEEMQVQYESVNEEKQKGVDGKVCWKGYKRMGTKKKGGKTVDNCVKM
jgi:predicted house-cleaning noncanonical NTP pyrophosphatase (MazG superfamily)